MTGTDISMIIFIAVIIIAIAFAAIRLVKKNMQSIDTVDDLINYLTSDEAKDKLINEIIPKLTEKALEDHITHTTNYETFKIAVVDDFSSKLYNFIEGHLDDLQIDDGLKKFVNENNVALICEKLFELDEVDTILNSCYTNYISKNIADAEKVEQEAVDTIAEMDKEQGPEPEDEYLELHDPEPVATSTEEDNENAIPIPDESTEVIENSETIEHIYPDQQ